MDAITAAPVPVNEPSLLYAPGSAERAVLEEELKRRAGECVEFTAAIGGVRRLGGGARVDVVVPHEHRRVLGVLGNSTVGDAEAAIGAAAAAAPGGVGCRWMSGRRCCCGRRICWRGRGGRG